MQQTLLNRPTLKYIARPDNLFSSTGAHVEQIMRSCAAFALFAAVALTSSAALAGDSDKSSNDPNFGNRTDKPDGSSSLTVGRKLPTIWETKIGTDVSLAAQPSTLPSENFATGTTSSASTGTLWGSITMPGFQPLGFDKTSLEARVDGAKDEGKIGAAVSRTVPFGQSFSMTWQNGYSVTQPLAQTGSTTPSSLPLVTNASPSLMGSLATPMQARTVDQTLKFNVAPWGTTFSAGASSSNLDNQWHNKLSIEQTVAGPLKVTTSVEDPGSAIPNKSITAGFKKTW
jgi:hypothetical protein